MCDPNFAFRQLLKNPGFTAVGVLSPWRQPPRRREHGFGRGLRLATLGIGAGLVAALAATRLLRSLLYGVSPLDPATFVVVPLRLVTVSMLACLLPARRAARVDPMEALRYE